MRQVPKYAIIGNGRVAKHILHYFNLAQIDCVHWFRQSNQSLINVVENTSHILLLIPDREIDAFIHQHACLSKKILIHFSGCLHSALVNGAHPLTTFGPELYTLEDYQKILFVLDDKSLNFENLLPGLSNAHVRIHQEDKAYYHSLCVMANNFTTLLWQKFFNELQTRFKISPQQAQSLFEQTIKNIQSDYQTALTGPLVRQDKITIEKNLHALSQDPFQTVFKAFIEAYELTNTGKLHEHS